jgi:hypothetical protein
MFVWSDATFTQARRLLAEGHSVSQVSKTLDVPRRTIGRWQTAPSREAEVVPDEWRPRDARSYVYVLGLYLGDGHVTHASRWTGALRIAYDACYPEMVAEGEAALAVVFPGRHIGRYTYRKARRVDLQVSCAAVLAAFPQHGPGKKHERPIVLTDWLRELTHAPPGELIRGLIHSDGCRTINRFKTKLPSGRVAEYEYPRYFFSNLSADIRGIFCEHSDLLGIRYTCGHERNVSIAHKASVAILENLVGAKK